MRDKFSTIITHLLKKNPDIVIFVLNAIAIYYIITSENISPDLQNKLLGIFSVITLSGLLSFWRKSILFDFFRNLQISIFFIVTFIFLLQFIYIINPFIYPRSITNFIESKTTREDKVKVVEYLNQSPFAKPKANVTIHVPGEYGSEYEFEYEWTTDKRGYKNIPEIGQKDQFDVIALGDSFTEGMGVKTENTWVSKLNKSGINAYSLGVQGYSVSQMNGTYKIYGSTLNPKLVIIGYLIGIYDREAFFLKDDKEITESKRLPSAIGRLVQNDLGNIREQRKQYTFVVSAIIAFLQKNIDRIAELKAYGQDPQYSKDPRFMPESLMIADRDISLGNMQRYKMEMEDSYKAIIAEEKLATSEEWIQTLSNMKEIANNAKNNSSQVLLLLFHNRGPMYLNRATGKTLNEKHQEIIETELLKKFTQENSILFLDTGPTLQKYIEQITDKTPVSEYPYLKYDGHLSNKGNDIIANLLSEYITSNRLLEKQ